MHVSRSITLAVLAIFASFANAQGVLTLNKPDPSVPPIGVQLKRSVVNVEVQCKGAEQEVPAVTVTSTGDRPSTVTWELGSPDDTVSGTMTVKMGVAGKAITVVLPSGTSLPAAVIAINAAISAASVSGLKASTSTRYLVITGTEDSGTSPRAVGHNTLLPAGVLIGTAPQVSGAGTGFLVGYTDPRLPNDTSFQYLVTNRHVAECWDERNHPRQILLLTIRVNAKDGSSRRLFASPAEWRFPNDDSVDLAVMSVTLPTDLLVDLIRIDDFATKQFMYSNVIAEGSPILLSGYFYQFPGNSRFEAIVRQGILSMVPDEPMTTTTGKPGTIYLCDVHIFGGNSGSPVMVTADWMGIGGYHLLGVVSGYYFEDANFNLEIATTVKGTTHGNSGVAMVVPADLLKALLDQPAVKEPREAYFAHAANAGKP